MSSGLVGMSSLFIDLDPLMQRIAERSSVNESFVLSQLMTTLKSESCFSDSFIASSETNRSVSGPYPP